MDANALGRRIRMPELSVTLVDHTQGTSDNFKTQIKRELEKILLDLLTTGSEPGAVHMRWVNPTPSGDQDLVIHWVQDVSSSYVFQQLGHKPGNERDAGFTASNRGVRGSEVYRRPSVEGDPNARFPAITFAKVAAHEGIHNMTRLGNAELHGRGGLADSPPQLPVTDANRRIVLAALSNLPDQLL
jgi:hypothetical protein